MKSSYTTFAGGIFKFNAYFSIYLSILFKIEHSVYYEPIQNVPKWRKRIIVNR